MQTTLRSRAVVSRWTAGVQQESCQERQMKAPLVPLKSCHRVAATQQGDGGVTRFKPTPEARARASAPVWRCALSERHKRKERSRIKKKAREEDGGGVLVRADGQLGTDPVSPQRLCQPRLSLHNARQQQRRRRRVLPAAPADDKLR